MSSTLSLRQYRNYKFNHPYPSLGFKVDIFDNDDFDHHSGTERTFYPRFSGSLPADALERSMDIEWDYLGYLANKAANDFAVEKKVEAVRGEPLKNVGHWVLEWPLGQATPTGAPMALVLLFVPMAQPVIS